MTTIELLTQAFPNLASEFYHPAYESLLGLMGDITLKSDMGSYQGDSDVLLRKDGRWGYLYFGWGSCSGCDALEACDNAQDLAELFDELSSAVRWFDSAEAAVAFFLEHDWRGSVCEDATAREKFVAEAIEKIRGGK